MPTSALLSAAQANLVQVLCDRVTDAIDQNIGGVDVMCAESSTLLALLAREHGLPAQVRTGLYCYHDRYGSYEEPHAHVLIGDLIADPTRAQFQDLPTVLSVADAAGIYVEDTSQWEDGEHPPGGPTRESAKAFLGRYDATPDVRWWTAEAMGLVCDALGLPELAPYDPELMAA